MDADEKQALTFVAKFMDSSTFRWLSIVAAFLTVASFIISIPAVQSRLFLNKPEISIQLVTQVPVLDLKQPVGGLQLRLNNRDLIAAGQSLVASRVLIKNTGTVSVTRFHMSSADPVGFRLENGSILKITRVSATSEHLNKFSRPLWHKNSISISSDVIIDAGDYVAFDLLILTNPKVDLKYVGFGKVEGEPKIPFLNLSSQVTGEPFLKVALTGSVWVHVFRLFFYTIIFIGLVALMVSTGVIFENWKEGRNRSKRESLANDLRSDLSDLSETTRIFSLNLYVNIGSRNLKSFNKRLSARDPGLIWAGRLIEGRIKPEGFEKRDGEQVTSYLRRVFSNKYVNRATALFIASEVGLANYENKTVSDELVQSIERLISLISIIEEQGKNIERFDPDADDLSRRYLAEDFMMRSPVIS